MTLDEATQVYTNRLRILALELKGKYNLSWQRAKKLGETDPVSSPLINKSGNPKVGYMKLGRTKAAIDIYIDYRLNGVQYGMGAYLVSRKNPSEVFFIVSGHKDHFESGLPLSEISDGIIPELEQHKDTSGQSFKSYEDADKKTRQIFEIIAPKRKQFLLR